MAHGADLGGTYEYIEKYARAVGKSPNAACLECLERICKAVSLVLETAESIRSAAVSAA